MENEEQCKKDGGIHTPNQDKNGCVKDFICCNLVKASNKLTYNGLTNIWTGRPKRISTKFNNRNKYQRANSKKTEK